MATMQFKKAKRSLSYLRLAIQGPSGSGKTYGALLLAKGLGGRIAVIDTERGSASLYADNPEMPEFDVLELQPPFTPERYIEAITAAREAGYDILVIDSMTHEWSGEGGCLDINDKLAKTSFRGNTWSAWSETTPRHRAFVDAMLMAPMHIVATMRSKTEVVQNEKGKFEKAGTKSEQRDGMDYEFTVVFDCYANNECKTSKDRTGLFRNDVFKISEETGRQIKHWLEGAGATPEEVAALKAKIIEAESVDELNTIGQEIASKGLCREDRAEMLAVWKNRKAELTAPPQAAEPEPEPAPEPEPKAKTA